MASLRIVSRASSGGYVPTTTVMQAPSRPASSNATSTPNNISTGQHQHSLKGNRLRKIEKLVGYPSLLSLRQLVDGELQHHLPSLAQKLLTSKHPAVNKTDWFRVTSHTARSPGLLTLLLSKAINVLAPSLPDLDQFGVSSDQRSLAEIAEMIDMAHLVHSEVVDLVGVANDGSHGDWEFGNKLLIIGGDLLLARACKHLSLLYKPQVVGIISQAIGDMMTGSYMKQAVLSPSPPSPSPSPPSKSSIDTSSSTNQIIQENTTNIMLPSRFSHHSTRTRLLYKSYFHLASLLSGSFCCVAILGEMEETTQSLVAKIGRNLAIFQLVNNDRMKDKKAGKDNVWRDSYDLIADNVCTEALDALDQLPNSLSKDALIDIVTPSLMH